MYAYLTAVAIIVLLGSGLIGAAIYVFAGFLALIGAIPTLP